MMYITHLIPFKCMYRKKKETSTQMCNWPKRWFARLIYVFSYAQKMKDKKRGKCWYLFRISISFRHRNWVTGKKCILNLFQDNSLLEYLQFLTLTMLFSFCVFIDFDGISFAILKHLFCWWLSYYYPLGCHDMILK